MLVVIIVPIMTTLTAMGLSTIIFIAVESCGRVFPSFSGTHISAHMLSATGLQEGLPLGHAVAG